MENLIFLVIAGLISLVFNRIKQNQPKQEPRSPRPVPEQKNDYSEPDTYFEKGIETIATQGENKFLEKQQEAKQRIADLKSKEQVYRQRVQRMKPVNKAPKKKEPSVNLRNIGSNDIVKGIVLSEVLGPPRSKKRNWRG